MSLTQSQIDYLEVLVQKKKEVLESNLKEILNKIEREFGVFKTTGRLTPEELEIRKLAIVANQEKIYKKAIDELDILKSKLEKQPTVNL